MCIHGPLLYDCPECCQITPASKDRIGGFGVPGVLSLRTRIHRCSKWNVHYSKDGITSPYTNVGPTRLDDRLIPLADRARLRGLHGVCPDHGIGLTRVPEEDLVEDLKLGGDDSDEDVRSQSSETDSTARGESICDVAEDTEPMPDMHGGGDMPRIEEDCVMAFDRDYGHKHVDTPRPFSAPPRSPPFAFALKTPSEHGQPEASDASSSSAGAESHSPGTTIKESAPQEAAKLTAKRPPSLFLSENGSRSASFSHSSMTPLSSRYAPPTPRIPGGYFSPPSTAKDSLFGYDLTRQHERQPDEPRRQPRDFRCGCCTTLLIIILFLVIVSLLALHIWERDCGLPIRIKVVVLVDRQG
ncbi:hypothetical protein HD806DRAFT_486737 [Xylariaceae sp. AK1471]|nr:hypothetical protein HD806DRAFT_486737 [Xylariaceae sp. AK1471]